MKINRPTDEQIQLRAYDIYLQRGGKYGHDIDDWLQAKYELLQLPMKNLAGIILNNQKKRISIAINHWSALCIWQC